MTAYIVPLDAKKLNVNQFMFGFHSIYNRFQFDWNESYDFQDFINYYQELQSDQRFLIFKTKKEAFDYTQSNEGIQPGYLVTIRSRVPVYKVELQVEFDSISINEHQQRVISKTAIKKLNSSALGLYHQECEFEELQQKKAEFDENIEKLKNFALNPSLDSNIKKSLNDMIDCIQQPTYKSLGFGEKKTITEKTILFIEGKITPNEYKNVIRKRYLGERSSSELKVLGGVLMALAIAVSACLLTSGAPVVGSLLIGSGLGMIGQAFFNMGQGSGVSKPLHEILDASTAFAPLRAN